tara:strand:+ start:193 stop:438 length:246 start_codon:yes stop_codon:yes gene_type:complete
MTNLEDNIYDESENIIKPKKPHKDYADIVGKGNVDYDGEGPDYSGSGNKIIPDDKKDADKYKDFPGNDNGDDNGGHGYTNK